MKKTDCIWMEKGALSENLCFWFKREGEDRDCDGCLEYNTEKPGKGPHEFTVTIEGRGHDEFESDVENRLRISLLSIYKEYDIRKIEISFTGSRSASVIEPQKKEE